MKFSTTNRIVFVFIIFRPRCSLVPFLFSQRYCFAKKYRKRPTDSKQMRTNALNSLSSPPSPDVASAGAHSYRNCALSPPLKGRSGTDWRISGNTSGVSPRQRARGLWHVAFLLFKRSCPIMSEAVCWCMHRGAMWKTFSSILNSQFSAFSRI